MQPNQRRGEHASRWRRRRADRASLSRPVIGTGADGEVLDGVVVQTCSKISGGESTLVDGIGVGMADCAGPAGAAGAVSVVEATGAVGTAGDASAAGAAGANNDTWSQVVQSGLSSSAGNTQQTLVGR